MLYLPGMLYKIHEDKSSRHSGKLGERGSRKLTVLETAPVRSGSETLRRPSGTGGTNGGGGEKDGGVWLAGGREPGALAGWLWWGRLCR